MKLAVELTRTGNVVSYGQVYCPASGMRRFRLTDLIVGTDATPGADAHFVEQVQRTSTVGTGTLIVPDWKDDGDNSVTAITLAKHIMTVEPTYVSTVSISIPRNQRTTARWNAKDGEEITVSATANRGLGFKQNAASSVTGRVNVHFEEL